MVKDFNLKRTPVWLILDSESAEHHRTVGFFSQEALIPSLMLGMAKAHFDQSGYEEALQTLESLLARYPEDDSIQKPFTCGEVHAVKAPVVEGTSGSFTNSFGFNTR